MAQRLRNPLTFCLALASLLFMTPLAHATKVFGQTCNVKDIIWDSRLWVDCTNTTSRFVIYSSVTCSAVTINQSIDATKIMQSLATAALLSGKTLSIDYENNCPNAGSTLPIYDITLNNQ